jgi:hypothetical protein
MSEHHEDSGEGGTNPKCSTLERIWGDGGTICTFGMAQSKRQRVELFEVYKRIGIRFTQSNGTFPVSTLRQHVDDDDARGNGRKMELLKFDLISPDARH